MNAHQLRIALLNAVELLPTANMLATESGARCITEAEAKEVQNWAFRNGHKDKFTPLMQNVALVAAGIETVRPLMGKRPNYEELWFQVWSTLMPYPVWLMMHTVCVLECIATRDAMESAEQAKTATIQ